MATIEAQQHRAQFRRHLSWELWRIPWPARLYILAIDAALLGIAAWVIMPGSADSSSTVRFGVVGGLAIIHAIAVDRVALLRRYLQFDDRRSSVWSNQTSTWTFAGALVLPLGYATALVLLVYGYLLVRGWQHKSIRTYRVVFAAGTTLIGVDVAHFVGLAAAGGGLGTTPSGTLIVVAQLIAYTTTSLVAQVVAARLDSQPSLRKSLPPRRAVAAELATLVLAVVAAELLLRDLALTPVVIFLAVALQRSSLVGPLHAAAHTDAKTGLLNAAGWRARASEAVELADRQHGTAALLMVDLDHFKSINDSFGHPAGDAVLQAVGETLREVPRKYDVAGRWGGEEFVVLLPGADVTAACAVAQRLRTEIARRTAAIGIAATASIGAAALPEAGNTVEELIAAADGALYAAKDAGRDRVVAAAGRPAVAAGRASATSPAARSTQPIAG